MAVSGRSLENIVAVGTELGYIQANDNVLISIDAINKYPAEKVTIITTGSKVRLCLLCLELLVMSTKG